MRGKSFQVFVSLEAETWKDCGYDFGFTIYDYGLCALSVSARKEG